MADPNLYVNEFRRITAGLKKRLLRKPNLQEVVEGYGSLAKKMESEELPQYAALCSMAMAKAEKGMKNPVGEAIAWRDAGRLFLQAEDSFRDLYIPSYKDHLIASIQCYLISIEPTMLRYKHPPARVIPYAFPTKPSCHPRIMVSQQDCPHHHFGLSIHVYTNDNKKPLAASLCLEIATSLMRYEEYSEALRFYHKAAELQADEEDGGYFQTIELAISCRLKLRDYQGVLKDISQITQTIRKRTDARRQDKVLLQKCEITQMLILLMLQPPKAFLSVEYSQLLTRYSADIMSDNFLEPHMDESIFILLQSLQIAIDEKDRDAKELLKKELWPHLTSEQQQLLTKLLELHDPHIPAVL